VVRRNLAACAENAKSVKSSNTATFTTYANHTLWLLGDQLDSEDTIWFPQFAKYDDRFNQQITAHEALKSKADELKALLPSKEKTGSSGPFQKEEISARFQELYDLTNSEYDTEENLSNGLGHRVPIEEIKELEKKQEARRAVSMKANGHLWSVVYLLKSLTPKERQIFPPGIPKAVASGMMTGGGLQFRKELQWSPKF
jgi:hypothetical protein